MSYDITKPQAPKMPALGKGTERIKNCPKKHQNTHKTPYFDTFPMLLDT